MVMITKEQQDRILAAAMRDLDIATEEDRRTVRIALTGNVQSHDLRELTGVFHRMLSNVSAELKVMGFEAKGDGNSPSESKH